MRKIRYMWANTTCGAKHFTPFCTNLQQRSENRMYLIIQRSTFRFPQWKQLEIDRHNFLSLFRTLYKANFYYLCS